MRKILILFLAIFLAFTYTSSHASVCPPKDPKSVNKELESEQREINLMVTVTSYDPNVSATFEVCYAQEAFTHCGTFEYSVCFENEPPIEQFLAVIDIIDAFINATCT